MTVCPYLPFDLLTSRLPRDYAAWAALTGARYVPPWAISAQAMRAVLLEQFLTIWNRQGFHF